jgi:hypothetical protein
MQSVPITTNVASSNFALVRCTHLQHYVKKFVNDLRQVGGFSGSSVSFTNKNDHHDKNEILLKVALNTITLNPELYQT